MTDDRNSGQSTLDALMAIIESQQAVSRGNQKSIEALYARIDRLHLWMTVVLIMQVLLAVGLVLT